MLRKRNKKMKLVFLSVIALVGIFTVGGLLRNAIAGPVVTVGNWSDYADSGWMSVSAERYSEYGSNTPGNSEEYPYLIETPAEFAYLGVVGQTQFAGKWIKLSKGCNCDEPLTEMDFSAHYWDPVYLYGGAYGSMYDDAVAAHIDGNNVALKGIKINHYVKAKYSVIDCYGGTEPGCAELSNDNYIPPGDEDGYLHNYDEDGNRTNGDGVVFSEGASGAGLFGELYKARAVNFRLIAPEITTTSVSDTAVYIYDNGCYVYDGMGFCYNDLEQITRQESAGALVGVARRTRILDSTVAQPNVQISEPYVGQSFMTGGMVGYASGYLYTINDHVDGGTVKLNPHNIDSLDDFRYSGLADAKILSWGQYSAQYGGDYDHYINYLSDLAYILQRIGAGWSQTAAQGGLIGMNYHSVVMNSSTVNNRVVFDLSGLSANYYDGEDTFVHGMKAGYPLCDPDPDSITDTNCYYEEGVTEIFVNIYSYLSQQSGSLQGPFRGVTNGIGVGGLVGVSSDSTTISACILNSYSLATIDVVGRTITDSNGNVEMRYETGPAVGGLAGYINDAVVNNYATLTLSIASLNGSYEWTESTIGTLIGVYDETNYAFNSSTYTGCQYWDDQNCVNYDEYWDDPSLYTITDNYYATGSMYPGIGGDGWGNTWTPGDGRDYNLYHIECDPADPTNCWQEQDGTETMLYAEEYSDNADLLAKLNSNLGDVERVVRGHLVNSNLLPPALANWWASKISNWQLNSGQPVQTSQMVLGASQPDNECTGILPDVPDTSVGL